MSFATRYAALNANQKQAVDTIEGPVMVIAGPGTGKTELLSMRAANILKKTDTLPESILCLTFTESGAHAMRERLVSIIGKDAYKVAIHTFHSFGSEIINQNGDFFYHGAHFRPADELSTHEIIKTILSELDYSNPLASKMNGGYTYLRDIMTTISDLKRSGLTSDELLQVLDANDAVLDAIEPELAEIFNRRVSATTIAQLSPIAHKVANIASSPLPNGVTSLTSTLALSIAHAVDAAADSDSTKPITAWKNKWLTKNSEGATIFKDRARHEKLRAVSYVYFQYLARMQDAELYDYDDMILRVVHALEIFDELRFNLQEKYQYIMVDEFQDTNLAQMRILASLTNNPAQGDTPNILVVGDDDQAIYSFQGADISNILSFRTLYPRTALISLTDNYRSGEEVLKAAQTIIRQGSDRLEQHLPDLDKTLTPHTPEQAHVSLYEAASAAHERQWLADSIKDALASGKKPSDITVITRRHAEIIELLPYLSKNDIPVAYERRDNVFDLEPIALTIKITRLITLLVTQNLDEADRLLPELLAHPAWGITTQDLRKLSLKAYDARSRWLDLMETLPAFSTIYLLFTELAQHATYEPLETMLDYIIGTEPIPVHSAEQGDHAVTSPLRQYYFNEDILTTEPDLYLRYLEGLRTIRTTLRDHHENETESITLLSFVRFIDLYQQTGAILTSIHRPAEGTDSVNLMTAHKSKGLEFDTVYITGAVESMWGERVRTRSRLISYPENMPLAAAGDSADERLRLFFVAVTRAKRNLFISYATTNDAGKPLDRAGFLTDFDSSTIVETSSTHDNVVRSELQWYSRIAKPSNDLRDILAPTLESYKLSATHLGNFLDVTRGGPETFLVHNLLRFPQHMSPAAAYGSAVHAALQRAHSHLSATGKQRALEDILRDYETELSQHRLSREDAALYSQKGTDVLQAFLHANYSTFSPSQKVELNFAGQQSIVDGAHLTGKLDLVDIDTRAKTMTVTDYKTGHPSRSWKGTTDYEKIKLHRYRQQLMFYKLLVEHSRDYRTFTVNRGILQFVEPAKSGEILALEDDFSAAELDTFRRLIAAVWCKITTLDLPKTDHFEQNYKGILAFEQYLLDENV